MSEDVKGFRSNEAIAKLKAEAQEPFRFFKLYAFGGLGAGAFIGLIIILTRLAAALKGGDDAPDLGETVGNLFVNAGAIALFGYLFKGELEQRELTQQKVEREEALGRLRASIADSSEDVLVSQFRGNYRLFVIAGSAQHVENVLSGLSKYKALLKEKNVIIATVDMKTGKEGKVKKAANPGAGVAALAAEFAAEREAAAEEAGEEAPGIEFGKRSRRREVAAATSSVVEKRWRVAPVDENQWRAWIVEEIERSGFDPTVRDVFFSLGKDGTLWKSRRGDAELDETHRGFARGRLDRGGVTPSEVRRACHITRPTVSSPNEGIALSPCRPARFHADKRLRSAAAAFSRGGGGGGSKNPGRGESDPGRRGNATMSQRRPERAYDRRARATWMHVSIPSCLETRYPALRRVSLPPLSRSRSGKRNRDVFSSPRRGRRVSEYARARGRGLATRSGDDATSSPDDSASTGNGLYVRMSGT